MSSWTVTYALPAPVFSSQIPLCPDGTVVLCLHRSICTKGGTVFLCNVSIRNIFSRSNHCCDFFPIL